MFDLTYNGHSGREMGVMVAQRPNIPAPVLNYTTYEIPGRDGVLTETDDTYGTIEIEVELNYVSRDFSREYRRVKKWLLGTDDMTLSFSDDTMYFYKVVGVDIGDNTRTLRRLGDMTVKFTCEPYQYRVDGTYEYDIADVLFNPYAVCHPSYIIEGYGDFELIVNDNTLQAYVHGRLEVNTDVMLCYREAIYVLATDEDGTAMTGEGNTALMISDEIMGEDTYISGDYQDMYLEEGENEITCTDGFIVKVIPNWREL